MIPFASSIDNKHWPKIYAIGILLTLCSLLIRLFFRNPWFDEVVFADITHSLMNNKGFLLKIILEPKEVLLYGPVYFFSQKVFCTATSFGMLQFRMLNFLSGIYILILFLKIARHFKFNDFSAFVLALLILYCDRFSFNMISGRMDLFAMALFVSGYYCFLIIQKRSSWAILLSGLAISLAFLSTPRVGFYFLVFPVAFALELTTGSKLKIFKEYVVLFLGIMWPVLLWVFTMFSGVSDYIIYVFNNPNSQKHFGGLLVTSDGLLSKHQYYLIGFWLIAGFIVFSKRIHQKNPGILTLFAIPILHVIFIKEVGPYSAMMMPFIYFGIIMALSIFDRKAIRIVLVFFALIIITHSISRGISALAYAETKNIKSFSAYFEAQNIPQGNILADYDYYYILTEQNYQFVSHHLLIRQPFGFEELNLHDIHYAVINKENYLSNRSHFEDLGFKVLSEFKSKEVSNVITRARKTMGRPSHKGYDGVILQR